MKPIAKRAVSLFLALSLTVPTAMAAPAEARETNFFRHDLYHAEQNFSEMEYKLIEAEPLLEEMESIRKLLDDPANAAQVERRFWEVDAQLLELMSTQAILTIRGYLDVNDEELANALSDVDQTVMELEDALFVLARDVLNSPCADFLKAVLSEEQLKKYLEYGEMDPTTQALTTKEAELKAKATVLLAKAYTAGYDATEWTLNSVDEALSSGQLTQESADAIWMSIRAAKNEELGKLYLEMLSVRNEIAKAKGYNSYPEYAYQEMHLRDYTPGEVDRLYADIKEYIVPLYQKVEALYRAYEAEKPDVFNHDYMGAGDSFLNLLEPYIARVSSEMQETFAYMREHGLYDIGPSDSKLPISFSAPILTYGAPYYYQSPNGVLGDLSTAVHEFGHYNNSYYDCFDPNLRYVIYEDDCTDTAEVHSQGFELIFSHFYPEIFGEDANLAEIYLHYALLKAIVIGALYDEFQQYAYATENVTLEQLNEKYSELVQAYGTPPTAREGGLYHWVDISHTFLQPCYYISYATSAAGAYTFWNAAQSDFFGAVDKYLQFVALGPETGFQSSFGAVGMTNPLSEGYLKELSETLYEKLELDEGSSASRFTDAKDIAHLEAVNALCQLGIISGKDDGSFDPAGNVTRAEAAKMICVLMNGGSESNTGVKKEPSFSDISGHWAEDYIAFCADRKIFSGRGDGTFDPDGNVTGLELSKMALVALGYDPTEYQLTGNNWAKMTLERAQMAKLYQGLDDVVRSWPASRDTAAQILYNMLHAKS